MPAALTTVRVRSRSRAPAAWVTTKTETTAYHDNTTHWLLGQVASVTDASGYVQESYTFDPTTAARLSKSAFGLVLERYAYHADGSLQARIDPAGRSTTFHNHKRGIAQWVAYANGTGESAVVNNIGRITAHTNAAGTTTTYGYDAMGRLSSINHPSEAGMSYHPSSMAFEQVNQSELGLAPGHWRQTTITGNARKVRYFDALWRERLVANWDATNPAATSSFSESRYDIDGRKTFASYPLATLTSVDTAIAGTAWAHDGLGRVFRQYQDSELGLLTTSTDYLPGFQKRVTNARGFATTFAFQAFDTPHEDAISAAWAPEGSTLTIARDRYGKPTAITRSGTLWRPGHRGNARICL